MAVATRKQSKIYLLDSYAVDITGSKLPSNRQVLSYFLYLHQEVQHTIRIAATLTIEKIFLFWEKAGILVKQKRNAMKKLESFFHSWQNFQKHEKRKSITQKAHEEKFKQSLDELFDVAHANALNMMTIEENKQFLMAQREKRRQGCMGGIDANLVKKEKKKQVDLLKHGEQQQKADEEAETSNIQIILEDSCSSATDDEDMAGSSGVSSLPPKRRRKQILTPALSSCLDRTNVSDRAAMFIVSETAKSLGHNIQDFTLSAASIRRSRRSHREQFANEVLKNFSPNAPLTVHWDGKLLPDLTRKKSVNRLPILVSFGEDTQLLSVPKIAAGTGKAQANAIYRAQKDWGVQDSVQALCFDTTSANIGQVNGACVMIEQLLSRDLLYLACRHHICYEFILILRLLSLNS